MKLSVLVFTGSLLAASSAACADIIIAADTSLGNPIMSSAVFAEEAAKRARAKISTLGFGERVTITTFGDGRIAHIKEKSLQVSRRLPAPKAAELVVGQIRSFATSHKPDGSTHILAFFEEREFNCEANNTEIWVLSDAVENSATYSGDKILKGKSLPKPFEKNLEGCKVVMIGAGLVGDRSLPRQQIQNIKAVWKKWLAQAGANDVTISVNP